jgi:hypothetical protein
MSKHNRERKAVRESALVQLLKAALAHQQALLDRDRRRGFASPQSIQPLSERMKRVEKLLDDALARGL